MKRTHPTSINIHTSASKIGLATIFVFCTLFNAALALELKQSPQKIEVILENGKSYKTPMGRSIYLTRLPAGSKVTSNPANIARFYVQGGLHGNESLAVEFVEWLTARYAAGDSLLNSLNGGQNIIDFVPEANPDGVARSSRPNAMGVNLNRNFGVHWGVARENPGEAAFSEPETRAIRDLLSTQKYAASVDVHGYVNWIVGPTSPTDPLNRNKKIPSTLASAYRSWTRSLDENMKTLLPGYQYKTAGNLGDGGAFEDYAFWGASVPSFCLELVSRDRYLLDTESTRLSSVPWITLSRLASIDSPSSNQANRVDMFVKYETYIFRMFNDALSLNMGLTH